MINILHYYCRPNRKDLLNNITYPLGISCYVNDSFLDISDITKELQNKKHVDCIAIDEELFGKFDTAEDIATKIEVLRFLCENTEILIIALNKAYDDEILETLRIRSMADFIVTSNMRDDFEANVTRYLNGEYKSRETKEKSGVSMDLGRSVGQILKNNPPQIYQEVEKPSTDVQNSYISPPEKLISPEKKILSVIPKRMITVGICGLQQHIGVTHHSLAMAVTLSKHYKSVCYKENNDHNAYRVLKDSSLASMGQGYINIIGIDVFDQNSDIFLADKDYKFCVKDFGYIRECRGNDFWECDIPIIVAGAKDWEFEYFLGAYSSGVLDNAAIIINFFPQTEQGSFKEAFSNLQLYFADYAPEVFAIGDNGDMYNRIIEERIKRLENE